MKELLDIFFEYSPFDTATTCLLSGCAAVGFDGQTYLTAVGEWYLALV